MCEWLIVGEQCGLDDNAHSELCVEFLVGEQTLPVAVVILQEKILVVAWEYPVIKLYDRIFGGASSLALGEYHRGAEASVEGGERRAHLVYAAIIEYVFVFRAVDDGYPEFCMHLHLRPYDYVSSERYLVP